LGKIFFLTGLKICVILAYDNRTISEVIHGSQIKPEKSITYPCTVESPTDPSDPDGPTQCGGTATHGPAIGRLFAGEPQYGIKSLF
jgi:hypothetical protein